MQINNFNYPLQDIAKGKGVLHKENESVLAKSVNFINYSLITRFRKSDKILEIGCGRSSYIRTNLKKGSWFGLDVYVSDHLGRKSIATEIGSVDSMPYDNGVFDEVVSNQSLEHWFEYGVEINDAINEIARVMKTGGKCNINFPLYLHGDPLCVSGNIDEILLRIKSQFLDITNIEGYFDSSAQDYKGWRLCGFPDFYVKSNTSFVVNIELQRNHRNYINSSRNKSIKRISTLRRVTSYGLRVFIWKLFKLLKEKLIS